MNRLSEWALNVHRIVWFPLHWMLGLESLPLEVPLPRDVHLARPAGDPRCRRRAGGGTRCARGKGPPCRAPRDGPTGPNCNASVTSFAATPHASETPAVLNLR